MICIQLKIKCKIILLKILENGLNKSYFMTYQALGNKRFLIVATDYFTKWIEAEPLSHIRDVDAKRFLWKSVITRFEIPWVVEQRYTVCEQTFQNFMF